MVAASAACLGVRRLDYFVRRAGIRPVTSATVNDAERLEHFAIMSGLAPQSVDAIRPDFPRWAWYVKENGVTEIPDSPLAGDFHAINMVSMLIRQKAGFKGDSIAHELRNLTGIRPWKPWLRAARIGPVAEPFTCRPDPPEAADANGARDPDPASAGPVPIRAGSGRPVSPVGAGQTLSQGCGEMPRI